jgi:hypothetical protein
MSSSEKKPNILPYGSNISAPKIELPALSSFLDTKTKSAISYFNEKLRSIEEEYGGLVNLAFDTEMVYNSKYNFIPIVGRIYHLYRIDSGNMLSMIEPHEWNKEHIGSFRFTADATWKRVDDTDTQ